MAGTTYVDFIYLGWDHRSPRWDTHIFTQCRLLKWGKIPTITFIPTIMFINFSENFTSCRLFAALLLLKIAKLPNMSFI